MARTVPPGQIAPVERFEVRRLRRRSAQQMKGSGGAFQAEKATKAALEWLELRSNGWGGAGKPRLTLNLSRPLQRQMLEQHDRLGVGDAPVAQHGQRVGKGDFHQLDLLAFRFEAAAVVAERLRIIAPHE